MTSDDLLREAGDPATPPVRLHELSQVDRRLWVALAGNPASYPALLDWLREHGDESVHAALDARDRPADPAPTTTAPAAAAAPVTDDPVVPSAAPSSSRATIRTTVVAALVAVLLLGGALTAVLLADGPDATDASGAPSATDTPSDEPSDGATEPAPDGGAPAGATDDFGVEVTAEDVGGTPADAPVVVELSEDFLCPVCGRFHAANAEFLDDALRTGEITVVYRPFAFLHQASTNDYTRRATNAAACVLDESGPPAYKAMHDLLLDQQPTEGGAGPEDSELTALAGAAGAPGAGECIESGRFVPWVDQAYEAGVDAGVTGTPFVLVGGQEIPAAGNATPADLQAAIDAAR